MNRVSTPFEVLNGNTSAQELYIEKFIEHFNKTLDDLVNVYNLNIDHHGASINVVGGSVGSDYGGRYMIGYGDLDYSHISNYSWEKIANLIRRAGWKTRVVRKADYINDGIRVSVGIDICFPKTIFLDLPNDTESVKYEVIA